MKTSYSWCLFFFVLGGIGMVAAQNMLFVKAAAQQPTAAPAEERQIIVEELPDGTIVQRSGNRILQTFKGGPGGYNPAGLIKAPDGGTVLLAGQAADPATAKLMQEEMQAAQQAQKLASDFRSADSDSDREMVKRELKDKLTAIFDMQQKRRASEVAKIEERLARLKETMQKRDSAKEDIVKRRLDVLTGGIDELGWEDTFRQLGPGNPATPWYSAPVTSPGPAFLPQPAGRDSLPSPTPVPATPAPPTRITPPSTSPVLEIPAEPAALPPVSR